ncbi:MAG: hypothetical protein R3E39_11065 [Anaerolineae bacterium]
MYALRFFRLIILPLLILGSLSSTALAQSTTLTYGDSADGSLANLSRTVRYTFEAEAGDTVTITAVSKDPRSLRLYLVIADAATNEIAYQDDSSGPNPAISNLYLAAAGKYTIFVRTSSGRGDFTISLNLVNKAADREVLFADDFSDNRHDWETGGNEIITGNIRDGKYVIRANCRDQLFTWFASPGFNDAKAVPPLDLNYVFETDVTVRPSEGTLTVGLLFDVQQPAYKTASMLNYYSSGFWLYRIFDPHQQDFADLDQNQSSIVDLNDGKSHHLTLSVSDTEVHFWIDDQHIAHFDHQMVLPGTIGVDAGCGSENSMDVVYAEFDNVRVTLSPSSFSREGDITA